MCADPSRELSVSIEVVCCDGHDVVVDDVAIGVYEYVPAPCGVRHISRRLFRENPAVGEGSHRSWVTVGGPSPIVNEQTVAASNDGCPLRLTFVRRCEMNR